MSMCITKVCQNNNIWVPGTLLSFPSIFMQVNDSVTFRLLKRPRDSIIPTEVHPTVDPSVTPGQESDQSGMESAPTTWGADRGHKEGTSTLPSPGNKPVKGDKGKEAKHRSNKQSTKESDEYGGRGFNKYAKFTRVGDGKAFWKAAAEELASYAAQVLNLLCMLCLLCRLGCAVLCYVPYAVL